MNSPRISIIIPLPDHRGHALAGIGSWLQQSVDRDWVQVVVIVNGGEPELESSVAELLGPHDLCLSLEGGSLHDCYNAGAQAAGADLLLFTESHVQAEPDCVAQVLAGLAGGDLDVAALASGGIDKNRLAAQEQTIYEEALATRIAAGWNLCTVRGFVVSRAAFDRSGGFQSRYGHFAELLLGATFKSQDARLGYLPKARVAHFNDGTIEHFARELAEFGRNEIRFRATQPDSPLLTYLGPCPIWEQRETFHRGSAARAVGKALARAGRGTLQGNFKAAGRGLEAAIRAIPFVLCGPAWLRWRSAINSALTQFRLNISYLPDRWYYSSFCHFWNGEIRRGRAAAVAEWLSQRALAPPENVATPELRYKSAA
jgi:glycosyltransferase involved in cell wall biosynthesis